MEIFMDDMSFDQKQIVALRTAVMFIASVLSDEQKAHLDMLVSAPLADIERVLGNENLAVTKEIYQMTGEILSLREQA